MNAALGLLLGLVAGALSVYSLWLITGFTARAATGLSVPPDVERPSGWDAEAQDSDVVTAGQWVRIRREEAERLQREPSPEPTIHNPHSTIDATLRIGFAFLLKAPLLFLVALGARSLGNAALHWCVGGVILVYCLAVFWAAARTRAG